MKKIWNGIFRRLQGNPNGIALLLIARRFWNGLTSSIMAFSLGASGLRLGPGCRIIGGDTFPLARTSAQTVISGSKALLRIGRNASIRE